MKIKGLQDEDFTNYKKTSMFIGTSVCDWKCCNEQCLDKSICQNSSLANKKKKNRSVYKVFRRNINNRVFDAFAVSGFDPSL